MSDFPVAAKEAQAKLKRILQADDDNGDKLEKLSAALVGRLLGVPIAIARKGFQHGGDAGPGAQHGRRFRLETKSYADKTSFSDRELLGEIDHALANDPALEAWVLIATRNVPEQLLQVLTQKGERIGVPVLVMGWSEEELCPTAALLAFEPDLVEALFSHEAAVQVRLLCPYAADAIASIRRGLEAWALGFESVRQRSHAKLDQIWTLPRVSNAELGQDAAGGADGRHTIRRAAVHADLNTWWSGKAKDDAPAAIIGWDGVGKTWAALDWLLDRRDEQPIIVVVPSSASAGLLDVSVTAVRRFIAERLHELTQVRDAAHWLARLDLMLRRPLEEGPVLTILFDGLNQEPSVHWVRVLKVLQSDPFSGRVRVLASTRTHHFKERLSHLNGLVVRASRVEVAPYGVDPGGELDQMLAFEGLSRADLHADLLELARIPRLFRLVVHLRDRLDSAEQVTLHRLLWEYGRDTLGARAGKSFSEQEWREWLRGVAETYRSGIKAVPMKALSESAARPDLAEHQVYARLSDIVDGLFVVADADGLMRFSPDVVTHALATGLLAQLDQLADQDFDRIDAELNQWLDPIGGFDAKADILRAAVSIFVERGGERQWAVGEVLVTAWLQTQNVSDEHRRELLALAPSLTEALLTAVERSNPHSQESARLWALFALREIPRNDGAARDAIFARARRWLSIISRDVERRPDVDKASEERRARHYIERVGADVSGPRTVVGVPLVFEDRHARALPYAAPVVMNGFPLAEAGPIFEAASVALAVGRRDQAWDGLKWLVLLNREDRAQTCAHIRDLSEAVRTRMPEEGVHPDLPARAAALLLWLTGDEADNERAKEIDPGLDRSFSYESDYLKDPLQSFYRLERQHAAAALVRVDVPLYGRITRTKDLWLDPTFEPPPAFVAELRAAASQIDPTILDLHSSNTGQDHSFEEFEPVLARCAPDILADLVRRKLRHTDIPVASRYWRAIRATEHLVLVGAEEAEAARRLRVDLKPEGDSEKTHVATQFLLVEGPGDSAFAKISDLIDAKLKFMERDLAHVVPAATVTEVDALIERYGDGDDTQRRDLVILLSVRPVELSEIAWRWFEAFITRNDADGLGVGYRVLWQTDRVRFGRSLWDKGWTWSHELDTWSNHYGSAALMSATMALPFEQVAPRLAPWLLLRAVARRGGVADEARIAADILSRIIGIDLEAPDPGSQLQVDRGARSEDPAIFSIQPRTDDPEDTPISALRKRFDVEEQDKLRRRAIETAVERVKHAKREGASLFLSDIEPDDLTSIIQCAPHAIDAWLAGAPERSPEFVRRVRLSEGPYVALCEALLALNPERGVGLWRALSGSLRTRYIGAAGVDELLNMAFRAPDSEAVEALRRELLNLARCNTDKDLFEVALAAANGGKSDWLKVAIEADGASGEDWRRKRAIVLSGLSSGNELPVPEAWPDGEVRTERAHLVHQAALRRWREACARHWWREFVSANEPEHAYAAWALFMRSADRRAWTWIGDLGTECDVTSKFGALKSAHAELNRPRMKRAFAMSHDKLDGKFLDRDIFTGVSPWLHEPEV